MGIGTLPTRADGQKINMTWFNVLTTALIQDLVPRNGSGVVGDGAGSIGTSSTTWLAAYLQSLKLRSASGKLVSLAAPSGLAADYGLTMPGGLPASTMPVRVSSSGIITFDQISGAEIQDGTVTSAKRVALAGGISASCGAFITGSTTYVDVTNLSVTVTPTGRPILVGLVPDDSATDHYVINDGAGSGYTTGMKLLCDSTKVWEYDDILGGFGASSRMNIGYLSFHTPTAGVSCTYKVQLKSSGGPTYGARLRNVRLAAYELF